MVKRKRRIGIFSVIITLILLCTSVFTPFFSKEQQRVAAEAVGNTIYAFVSKRESASIDTKLYVDFGLSLDYAVEGQEENEVNLDDATQMVDGEVYPFEYATIYIRTRNRSAVAEQGDYEAIDESFVVYGTQPYASLAINVNKGCLQLNPSDSEEEGALRDFVVEIYRVEIVGYKSNAQGLYTLAPVNTTPNISTDTLYLSPDHVLTYVTGHASTDKNGNRYNLNHINNIGHVRWVNRSGTWLGEITETGDHSANCKVFDLANESNFYENMMYLSEHNMMKLGLKQSGTGLEYATGYVNNAYVGVQFFAGDASKEGSPALKDVPQKYIYDDPNAKELATWYIKFQSDYEEELGLHNSFNGKFEGVTVNSYFDESVLISDEIASKTPNVKNGKYDYYVENGNADTLVIDDLAKALDGSTKMSLRYWMYYSGTDKSVLRYSVLFLPVNYRAELSNATLGKVYYDENGTAKLGVSLRFSEPVQLRQYENGDVVKPSVSGYLNMAANAVTFDYVSGNGTDTFYFETELPEMNITSVKLEKPNNFDVIYDFAPNSTEIFGYLQNLNVMQKDKEAVVNGWDNVLGLALPCAYDLRKPRLAVETRFTTEAKKSAPIMVRTENISDTGKLYYGWSTVQGQLPEYISIAAISASGTQIISSPSNVSGARYLYAVAVSELDKRSEEIYSEAVYFDNAPPLLGEIGVAGSYVEKTFTIPITNNAFIDGDGNQVTLDHYANLKSVQILVSSDKDGKDVVFRYTENFDTGDDVQFSYTLNAASLGLKVGEQEFGTYYISFVATDALENRIASEPMEHYFDIREIFTVSLDKTGHPDFEIEEFTSGTLLPNNYYTIDLSKKANVQEGESFYVRLKSEDAELMEVTSFVKISDGEEIDASSYIEETADGACGINLAIKDNFTAGFYRLIIGETDTPRQTLPIYFYVTNGKVSVEDGNGSFYRDEIYMPDNAALTNKVYQLPVEYYYLTDTGTVTTVSYSGTSRPVSFSSKMAASSYILYREYMDLYAIRLTKSFANDLNSGIRRKADGVTQYAAEGQIWIRYKEVNWSPNTTTTKWVYYYYGEDASTELPPINPNALSNELQIALSTVTNLICSFVEEVNLVTEDWLDNYGSPKLYPEQIPEATSSLTSNGGTVFSTAIEYYGDNDIYYAIDGDLPLVTNTLVGGDANSRLFYRIEINEAYKPLTSGQTFGKCIQATGRVSILELTEEGALEYYVFVDNEEPILSFILNTSAGEQTKSCSSADESSTISGGNVYITGLQDDDELSYVAIYRYTSQGEGDLLKVYRKRDFDNGQNIPLEDGKYHVYVSDRAGNSYLFVLQVRSDELEGSATMVGSSYVRFEMNRDEEELQYYRVYLDGRLLTTNYSDRRFTESGVYKFEVKDIYGQELKIEYPFNRTLPTVDWRYKTDDGSYLIYDPANPEESTKLTIEKVNDQTYKLFTSTYLHFLPLDGCMYEIISGTPSPSDSVTSNWVMLNQITSFSMKVYYEADPNVYVIYTCVVDNTAPIINVSYDKNTYQAAELEEIQQKFANGDFKNAQNAFYPSFIGFTVNETSTFYVTNGTQAQSKYFKVQVSDDYGVAKVEIYLNDELINAETTDLTYAYLSRRGTYKIVATDEYGNKSTFNFTNEYNEHVEYFVDGEKLSTDVSFADYFNEANYTKVEYGNSEMEIKLLSSAEIHYIITDAEGNKKHFAFVVKDGVMYTFQYLIELEEGEQGDLEIENIFSQGQDALKSGLVAEIKELDIAIYLSKNADGSLSLSVRSMGSENAPKEKIYTVEVRIVFSKDESPYYFKTQISTIPSKIEFIGENINLDEANNMKVSEAFEIDFSKIGKDIQSVEVAFSKTGHYTEYETIYTREDGVIGDIRFIDDKGQPYSLMYYRIKVTNVYGIVTEYNVMLSSEFSITATVEYSDGSSTVYDDEYTSEYFYSNKSVEFIASSTNITVVEASGKAVSVTPTEQGYTVIYIDTAGDYVLTITDEYGNAKTKYVSIAVNTLSIDEDLLTGFNDQALRREENYTNQEIHINSQAVLERGIIAFISMRYQTVLEDGTIDTDETITLYDTISQKGMDLNETSYVGSLGDGKYTLIFRDRYGNKAEEVIQYCGTPTLTITRNILNGVTTETYSLDEIETDGVWTNDTVTFEVSATQYVLTVDGLSNVTSISYATKTKNEYDVYYLDEYGFKYTFKVYLHREEVMVAPTESVSISQLSDLLVTRDGVQMLFTENATCTYTLNSEAEKAYNAGEILYKDGIYHFKVIDKAGNIATYTVKKDSAVEYRLEGTGTNEILINGGITNGHSVRFYSENSDNVYIKKVFLNNEFIEYDDTMFTERGKWELIVADDVGNESYFRFYIIHGKLDGFLYSTPYNYEIASVMWEMEESIAEATETIKEAGLRLEATENGTYTVTMLSLVTGDTKTFTFTIDKTPPQVELVGCNQNEKTINNITLNGCEVGDTIYVYKDDELVKTVRIASDYMDAPTISEAGKYKIVVENEAGLKTEFVFERKYVPNVAGSVLIIILAFASVAGFFVGLIWRNHSKTDE